MKLVAVLLLLGVVIRHDTAFTLSGWSGMSPSGVFYILGGAWEVVLCLVLLAVLSGQAASVWRSLAGAALSIGIVEGGMMSACRAMLTTPAPLGTTNCDHVTGLPVGAVVLTLEILVVCWVIGSWARTNGGVNA